MKKILSTILLAAACAGVYAQAPQTPRVRPDATKLPKPLISELKLSADQQTKVDAILHTKKTQMDSLMAAVKTSKHPNPKLTDKKMLNIYSESNDKLYAVFNQDQKLVYAQWILDKRAQFQKKAAPKAP